LPITLPVIEFNGGIVSDYDTGRRRVVHDISTDIKGDLLDLLLREGFRPFVSTFDGEADRLYYDRTTNDGAAWYLRDRIAGKDSRLKQVSELASGLEEQVVCLTLIDTRERIDEINRVVEDRFQAGIDSQCYEARYEVGWHWLTIHSDQATKGEAVRTVMGEVGCSAEEVIVFGDEVNDVGMLQLAGRGIAVENAIPSVIEVADQVIGSNGEDSVARFLEADWEKTRNATE
jgi:hydroxymethylpyrimidine pyrophosphatase-like HAD family hydrolase